jgi:hypothetical protein
MKNHCAGDLALSLALALIAALPREASAQSMDPQNQGDSALVRERLDGATFRYVGGDAQRTALRQAIDQTIAPMNFIVRPIARGRLAARNVVENTVAFRIRPGTLTVSVGSTPTVSRDDYTPSHTRAVTGEPMQVRQRILGDRLVQSLSTADGERIDEFVVSPDGHHLTMNVTVRSSQLPRPLRYHLDYAR